MNENRLVFSLLIIIIVLGSLLFVQSLKSDKQENRTQKELNLDAEMLPEKTETESEDDEKTKLKLEQQPLSSEVQNKQTPDETIRSFLNALYRKSESTESKAEELKPYVTAEFLKTFKDASQDSSAEENESNELVNVSTELKNIEIVHLEGSEKDTFLVEYVVVQTIEGSLFPTRIEAVYTLLQESSTWKIEYIEYKMENDSNDQSEAESKLRTNEKQDSK